MLNDNECGFAKAEAKRVGLLTPVRGRGWRSLVPAYARFFCGGNQVRNAECECGINRTGKHRTAAFRRLPPLGAAWRGGGRRRQQSRAEWGLTRWKTSNIEHRTPN